MVIYFEVDLVRPKEIKDYFIVMKLITYHKALSASQDRYNMRALSYIY